MASNTLVRIRFLSAVLILIALLLISRLYVIQIVEGDMFAQKADRQYVRSSKSLFDRGIIFLEDKDGRLISGATLQTGFTLAISPDDLDNPLGATKAFLELIEGFDTEDFIFKANKKGDPYEEITTRLSKETAEKIESLGLSGVNLYKDRWRFYPGGALASHVLGFVAFDDDELSGVYGLERYYNDTLNRDEQNLYVNFFAEIFANLNKTIFNRASERAGDIITSIDPSVELALEEELLKIHEEWGSKLTAGIIMNPNTGEIYALSANPTFDLNNFKSEENFSVFSNPLVENVYEMGSIIKPITIAAGLDSKAITPKTTYIDHGFIELDGYTVSNFDARGRGEVPMQEVLSQSLNTGAAFVVSEMGNDVFVDYIDRFSIGKETGIDVPNESAGLMDNLNSPRDIEYATASFGQGIATSPIATVRALSVLANGGVLITPHFAKEVRYKNGLSKKVSFNDGVRVIKKETAETITRMLVEVVDEALLDGSVKMDRYSIAAKTGTAQIAKVGERGYYDDRFLHSFFGYFPAYDPEFLIFLYTVEPKGVRYASQTLTHPFMNIVRFLTNYYQIPPDR